MGLKYDVNKDYESYSRYRVLRALYDTDTDERWLETYNQVIIPLASDDRYHIVQKKEAGRIDLISYATYGTTIYWWAIALANNIIDPFLILENDILRIPSLMTLSDIDFGILSRRGVGLHD